MICLDSWGAALRDWRLWAALATMAAIVVVDVAVAPADVEPFLVVPVLAAAAWLPLRQVALLAVAAGLFAGVCAIANPGLPGVTEWVWVASIVVVAGAAVWMAQERVRREAARRAAEEARRAADASYRVLADNITDVVYMIDPAGRATWISPSIEQALGWRPDELIGTSVAELMDPADRASTEDLRRSLHTGADRDVETFLVRIRAKDGTTAWAYGSARAVFADDGSAVGAVVAARVVDDLVRAQDEAIAAHEETQAERDRLRAVLDNASYAHMLLEPLRGAAGTVVDFVCTDANEAACAHARRTREELVGTRLADLDPSALRDAVTALCHAALERGAPLQLDDYQLAVGEDVVPRWFDIRLAPIGSELSVWSRDVTDRHQAADRLRVSQAEFRMLAENASDVVYRTDDEGRLLWLSPSTLQVLGYEPEHLSGRAETDLLDVDDREVLRAMRAAVTQGTQPLRRIETDTPVRYRTASGEVRWMAVHLTPVDGPEDGGFVVGLHDVTEAHAAQQELAWAAFHDEVTGLRNRAWVMDMLDTELAVAQRTGTPVGVLFVDLDNFKVINDSMGHAAGDEVLTLAAQRLLGALRPGDHIGRFGGDEFVVVVPEVAHSRDVEAIAERLMRALTQELRVAGHTLVPTASIGVAVSNPGATAATLLRDADAALFRAKADGRNRWHFFDQAMHVAALERLTLEAELRHALDRAEFVVHYQPVVTLGERRLCGYEALVRWEHPDRGLQSPPAFIPVAEESGLIAGIGDAVLDQVLHRLRAEPDLPGRIAVNISAVQLNNPAWADGVLRALRKHRVDPGRLALEVTETAVLTLTPDTRGALQGLRDLGVHLYVDDFGTGYSSVALLRDLPVSGLKLDLSFVAALTPADSPANALAAGLAGLAHGLHLVPIAEGVETEEQAALLHAQGWTHAQGYLFGRPQPAATTAAAS